MRYSRAVLVSNFAQNENDLGAVPVTEVIVDAAVRYDVLPGNLITLPYVASVLTILVVPVAVSVYVPVASVVVLAVHAYRAIYDALLDV